jgi:hypothetical protein
MAAGLGFKDFVTGEVLTAADVDGYLMQGVWVFASAAARDSAVTSPQEGNFAYLKDTNVTTYYTGSAWANLDTTGMTNPMTTTGDTIYSSSGSTPARLGIGTTGQVLTVAGGVPSWATPAGGSSGLTLIKSQTVGTTVASVTVTDAFSATYDNYVIMASGITASTSAVANLTLGATTTGYYWFGTFGYWNSATVNGSFGSNVGNVTDVLNCSSDYSTMIMNIHSPYLSSKSYFSYSSISPVTGGYNWQGQGYLNNSTSYTAFTLTMGSGTITGGTIKVYGYQNS